MGDTTATVLNARCASVNGTGTGGARVSGSAIRCGRFCDFRWARLRRPVGSPGRPFHLTATEQMEVKMRDVLSAVGSAIDHDTIAVVHA